MGTISSGVGLISGLDTQSLIERLLTIDSRPRELLKQRVGTIDAQKAAYLDISARITAMLARINVLGSRNSFLAGAATSSAPGTLTASVGETVTPGAYSFLVRSLATTQQTVSRGFASATSPLPAGTISIESAKARVNSNTRLDELNGYSGVQRGSFRITDAAGVEKTVNIADAQTLSDVVDRINNAGNNVRAEIRNDRVILTESTGGSVRIREVDGGRVAANLGFGDGRTSSTTGRIEGSNLVFLSTQTPLTALNDGNGVRTARAGGDFTINGVIVDLSTQLQPTTRIERLNHGDGANLGRIKITTRTEDGSPVEREVDLTGLQTLGEIKSLIEEVAPDVAVTMTAGKLVVGYSGSVTGRALKIEDLSGTGARDLGIDGEGPTGRISGREILFNNTVGDVLSAINFATGNEGTISAAIDGGRIVINGGATVDLDTVAGSTALTDLGFTKDTFTGAVSGRRILGGVNTTLLSSLDGGRGITASEVRLNVGANSLLVTLRGAETLEDAVSRINDAATAANLGVEIGYDATGTRLIATGADGQAFSLADTDGNFATKTGLTTAGTTVRGTNLQRQYVSSATSLASLNGGRGVSLGTMKITNSLGATASIELGGSSPRNLGDVIEQINASNIGVTARINDTGDGLLIEDSTTGSGSLKIQDESGAAARDLNIRGEFSNRRADGSYEVRIDVSAGTSLQDLVTRINANAGSAATASILNDGTAVSPFRLQLTAKSSGLAGEVLIDGSAAGLDFTTLTRAQDAQVLLGTNPQSGVVLTSSSNTFTNVVPGLNLTLVSASETPVTVTVNRDIGGIREAMKGLVEAYNAAFDRISTLGDYDSETEKAGVLLGESALRTVESRLNRVVTGSIRGASGTFTRLSQLGIRITAGKLSFDEAKFNQAYESDPQAVADFFTKSETGAAAVLKKQIEALTQSDGVIDRRTDNLETQKTDLNLRIDQLGELLERKRDRLTRQFQAMESALAQLQSQQSTLGQLAALGGK